MNESAYEQERFMEYVAAGVPIPKAREYARQDDATNRENGSEARSISAPDHP